MINIVAGYYFKNGSICLIRKTHPTTHAGKLCGVGGKIEPGESPVEAMVREFHEETGVLISLNLWTLFCTVSIEKPNKLYSYRFINNRLASRYPITRTDEEVGMYPLANLHWPEVYPTERWLIPMAKDAISHGHVYNVQELL